MIFFHIFPKLVCRRVDPNTTCPYLTSLNPFMVHISLKASNPFCWIVNSSGAGYHRCTWSGWHLKRTRCSHVTSVVSTLG